jgi:putative oxidoreductase
MLAESSEESERIDKSSDAFRGEGVRLARGRRLIYTLQIFISVVFVAAGTIKFFGPEFIVRQFDLIGLGQWLRYATGSIETIGAICLVIPRASVFGALLLSCVMVGATLAHLTVLSRGFGVAPPLIFLLFTGFVAWYRVRG